MVPDGQRATAALLERLAGEPPVETHISAVFRGPDTVWKLKKAVRLSFVDFTALDARRHFLERELALNAPWAPGLYRDVVPVVAGPDGPALGGPGEPIDWVLRMARVPDGDFLDRAAADGRLGAPVLDALADVVADMHAALPPCGVPDAHARLQRAADGNAKAAVAAGLPGAAIASWHAGITAALAAQAGLLAARAAAGRVCRAHGDLHLGNLLLWQGRPTPFDALEFDEELATIDLGYDAAFLLMDLDCTLSRAAANRVLGRYVARSGDAGLVAGLPAFLSLRALVRAHVAASRQDPAAGRYLDAALAYLKPAPAAVLAIGGLMGTGKTTLARALAPGIGPAPGALLLRKDEIRKRLFGAHPEQRLGQDAYTPGAHARTSAAMLDAVATAARAGHAVVADATFMEPGFHAQVAGAARAAGLPFLGLWLEAPLDELERRVAARTGDASDATVAVLRDAAPHAVPPPGWVRLDATDAARAMELARNLLGTLCWNSD